MEENEAKVAPSIHDIIYNKDRNLKQEQIDRLFQIRTLPSFTTFQLKQNHNLLKNDLFIFFIKILDDWNTKIANGKQSVNFRSQLFRNQFIYTSLKSILVQQNYTVKKNLQKLYTWYCKNSQGSPQMIQTTNNHTNNDDDWQIRKTFKTNVPIELSNYKRKRLDIDYFLTFNGSSITLMNNSKSSNLNLESRIIHTAFTQSGKKTYNQTNGSRFKCLTPNNNKQNNEDQRSKATKFTQYKLEHEQIRRRKEIREIQAAQKNWRTQKSRYQEHTSINFYNQRIQKNTSYKKLNENKLNLIRSDGFNHIKQKRINNCLRNKILINKSQLQTPLLSIDGLNLISNPFQVKSKIKKKK